MAEYLYNGPEYLESVFAAFKAGLVPVNTNYRYADEELVYLWDNADAEAVVFHGSFAERIERIRVAAAEGGDLALGRRRRRPPSRLGGRLRDGGGAPRPTGSWRPGDAATTTSCCIYTGGTTGMPKGVMWRQDTLVAGGRVERQPRLAGRRRLRRGPGAARPAGPGTPLLPGPRSCTAPASSRRSSRSARPVQVVLLADRSSTRSRCSTRSRRDG